MSTTPLEKNVEELVHTNDINPTNAEIREDFREHAKEDHAFQEETRKASAIMEKILVRIESRLEGIENKLDPDHEKYVLTETNKKVDKMWDLVSGLTFSGNAIKYTSGIVLAITVIAGSIIGFFKLFKG